MFFRLVGDHTLGRNESRPGELLDVRDYCKLHIILHYVAVLLGAGAAPQGPRVVPIGKVGDDEPGRRLIDEMRSAGMDTTMVQPVADHPTTLSVCFQYPDGSGGNITTSNAAGSLLSEQDVDRVEPLLAEHAGRFMALAAPEVPLAPRRRLLELASKHGAFRVGAFSSAQIGQARSDGVLGMLDLISMNEDEAAALCGVPYDPADASKLLEATAAVLTRENPDVRIIITAGARGAYGFQAGRWRHSPARSVTVRSTAGAGDALLAGAMVAEALGLSLLDENGGDAIKCGLDLAVLLAAASCTSPHTIHPTLDAATLLNMAQQMKLDVNEEIRGCICG